MILYHIRLGTIEYIYIYIIACYLCHDPYIYDIYIYLLWSIMYCWVSFCFYVFHTVCTQNPSHDLGVWGYALTQINLVPALRSLSSELRQSPGEATVSCDRLEGMEDFVLSCNQTRRLGLMGRYWGKFATLNCPECPMFYSKISDRFDFF